MIVSTATTRPSVDTVTGDNGSLQDLAVRQLQREVRRISDLLERVAADPQTAYDAQRREPPSPFIEDHYIEQARSNRAFGHGEIDQPSVTAKQVRTIISKRRQRERHFDADLFADPAWDMMLDLYACWLDRKRVSVSSLCIAAAVPATTALRWIKLLEKKGHLVRVPDQHDARRIYVALSPAALLELHRYFAQLPDVPTYV